MIWKNIIFGLVVLILALKGWGRIVSVIVIYGPMITTLERNGAVLDKDSRFRLTSGILMFRIAVILVLLVITFFFFRPYLIAFVIANAICLLFSLFFIVGTRNERVADFCYNFCSDDILITDKGLSFEEVSEALAEKQGYL